MAEWLDLIGKVGFPILMCGWFAFRLERLLESIVKTNDRILNLIESQARKDQ